MDLKKHLTLSNLLFVIAMFLLLHKPSRAWFLRQIAFSPSVEKVADSKQITNYNWQLQGLNVKNINLSAYKGKVIFINFWATWCPPCIAEMPAIQKLYNDYKDKVVFVFVTSDGWQLVDEFYKENNYNLPTYTSVGEYLQELPNVNSIPRTFVLDKNGFIRVDKTGTAKWNSDSFREKIDVLLTE